MAPIRYTAQDQAARVALVHNGRVSLDTATYVGWRTRCRFVDVEFGEWFTTPISVILLKRGHPRRGYQRMATKQTLSRAEVERRVFEVHGDTVLLGEDYAGIYNKCTFIDSKYGPWKGRVQHVLARMSHHPKRRRELSEATCKRKYGALHHTGNPIIMGKISSSTRRAQRVHWRTGATLNCASSYETAFIEWCNHNRIDFEWQIQHPMPDGRAPQITALEPQRAARAGYYRSFSLKPPVDRRQSPFAVTTRSSGKAGQPADYEPIRHSGAT